MSGAGRKKIKGQKELERVQSVRLSDWAEKRAIWTQARPISSKMHFHIVSYCDDIKYNLDKI